MKEVSFEFEAGNGPGPTHSAPLSPFTFDCRIWVGVVFLVGLEGN